MTDHLAAARRCIEERRGFILSDKARLELLEAAVSHVLDHFETQQAPAPDPLDETNHADRYDLGGDRWSWCDKCCGFRMAVHTVHGPGHGWLAVEIDQDAGPLTFAPRPAATPATAPQPEQAHGDAGEPARPELNVQTALPETPLHDLPVGSVIRADGQAYVHTDAWEWVETVTGTASTSDELATHHPRWHAIHTPQEPE